MLPANIRRARVLYEHETDSDEDPRTEYDELSSPDNFFYDSDAEMEAKQLERQDLFEQCRGDFIKNQSAMVEITSTLENRLPKDIVILVMQYLPFGTPESFYAFHCTLLCETSEVIQRSLTRQLRETKLLRNRYMSVAAKWRTQARRERKKRRRLRRHLDMALQYVTRVAS